MANTHRQSGRLIYTNATIFKHRHLHTSTHTNVRCPHIYIYIHVCTSKYMSISNLNFAKKIIRLYFKYREEAWRPHHQISMISCQMGPTHHAYAWQIGPFWQDTLAIWLRLETLYRLLGPMNGQTYVTSYVDLLRSIYWKPEKANRKTIRFFGEFGYSTPWVLFPYIWGITHCCHCTRTDAEHTRPHWYCFR